jgi:TolB protein
MPNHLWRAAALCGAVALLVAAVSHGANTGRAAFPGMNGDIVFGSDRAGGSQIFRVPSSGGEAEQLTTEGSNSAPTWSPDGSRIAFRSSRDGDEAIYVMNADGTNETRLTAGRIPAWSADGSKIAFAQLTGPQGSQHYAIFTVDADGGSPVVLIDSAGEDTTPVFSPDGTRIAYGHADIGEDMELYVADADGSNPTPLTDNSTTDYYPDWSPDSSRIVYQCDNGRICAIDADGNNQQMLPQASSGSADYSPVWSPDGSRIAIESYPPGDEPGGIYTMDPDDSDVQTVTQENDYEPDWQPLAAPTPTPTASPTPSPTPTPTLAPGERTWGDGDCGGAVNLGDAIGIARHLVSLPVSQEDDCPGLGSNVTVDGTSRLWQDIDCSGGVSLGDAIGIARHLVSLPVNKADPQCADVGETVAIG